MILVGITGGIGSGKSLVTRIFSLMGIPIYDADTRAKWLMNNDLLLKDQIRQRFGNTAYKEDDTLNRAFIASKVFNNKKNIAVLNSLVHPIVGNDFQKWARANSSSPYLVKEAALLFESGSYQSLDKIVTVFAPEAMRLERTLKRDPQRTREDVKAIMNNQWDEKRKMEKADYIIYNDGSQLVIPQVVALDEAFRKKINS